MKKMHFWAWLVLLVWLSSCANSRVSTDKLPSADLAHYHTFKFADAQVHATNPLYYGSLIDHNIHAHIATELTKRGLVEDTLHADLIVIYHTYTEQKQSSINNYYPMMYGGWGWRYYPWGFYPYPYGMSGFNRTYTYTEGTLIVDLADARTNQVVWRGWISNAVDNPASLEKQIAKGIALIFKKYPIPPDGHFEERTKVIAGK